MEPGESVQAGLEPVSGVVYGIHIRGELPIEFQSCLLPPVEAGPDPKHSVEVSYRPIRELPEVAEFWVQESRNTEANSRFAMFGQPDGIGLTVRCQGGGLFRFTTAGIAIEWLPGGTGPAHYFFSHALPLWLALQGVPVLHASAVYFDEQAVAFIGRSGMGKSTLCAALTRSGHGFVAEDGLPVSQDGHGNWRCSRGPPMLRLWPTSLQNCLATPYDTLPRVHAYLEKRVLSAPAEICLDTAVDPRLAAIYVLERRPETSGEVSISPCSRSEALIRLIEHSLASSPAAALGLAEARLQQLSRLAEDTQVAYLGYPSGSGQWSPIEKAIADDLAIR